MIDKNTRPGELSESGERAFRLAHKTAQKAVIERGVLHISERTPERKKNHTEIYFDDLNGEIRLFLFSEPRLVSYNVVVSFTKACFMLVSEIDRILGSKKAKLFFLFDPEACDREKILFQEALEIAKIYLKHLPLVIFHSQHQAFSESIVAYLTRSIEPVFQAFWEDKDADKEVKLIKDNNLRALAKNFPDVELPLIRTLESVDRHFRRYRTNSIKGREAQLTKEMRNGKLAEEYDDLRPRYSDAKRAYKKYRNQYERTHRNMNAWAYEREIYLLREFPNLVRTGLLDTESPANLAAGHLALKYGLKPSYMRALIFEARRKRKTREVLDQMKANA